MSAPSDARVALLERPIDHAPLFPPASPGSFIWTRALHRVRPARPLPGPPRPTGFAGAAAASRCAPRGERLAQAVACSEPLAARPDEPDAHLATRQTNDPGSLPLAEALEEDRRARASGCFFEPVEELEALGVLPL